MRIFLFKNENKDLDDYRKDVITKLNTKFKTDYLLYQQLGFIANRDNTKFDTKRYVDDAKTIGIFFISLIIILIIFIFHLVLNTNQIILNFSYIFSLFIATYYLYYLGKELILSKYRSRAIRIYTNYMLDNPKDNS